jgi:hypothetical protein
MAVSTGTYQCQKKAVTLAFREAVASFAFMLGDIWCDDGKADFHDQLWSSYDRLWPEGGGLSDACRMAQRVGIDGVAIEISRNAVQYLVYSAGNC